MLDSNIVPVEIPQSAISGAIATLTAAGFEASILQPDKGPAEIFVAYMPRRRRNENISQEVLRMQNDAFYGRLWRASNETVRITDQGLNRTWSYSSLGDAISALIESAQTVGRA